MHSLVVLSLSVQLRSLLPVISLIGDVGLEQVVECGCRAEGRNPGALGGLGRWGFLSGPLRASLPPAFADVCVQWSLPLSAWSRPWRHIHFGTVLRFQGHIHQFTVSSEPTLGISVNNVYF